MGDLIYIKSELARRCEEIELEFNIYIYIKLLSSLSLSFWEKVNKIYIKLPEGAWASP